MLTLGPGAFTRQTAYILCVCACLEGSLLFSGRSCLLVVLYSVFEDTSGTTPWDESHPSQIFTPRPGRPLCIYD